ncbi:LOW QUALITY PROTEIN: hypothetical protein MAR_027583 [Mya arenaria]|uniref:Uncharacterized protein n=1 Tax=Mya arenaria TaxID=6604 RepID=A0ABY7EY00_MYAAR|nr:LOW QUALITY PROTEIN: hypothetical protein MAR_027583 [Mya arenaria]
MHNLHSKFSLENPGTKISRSRFCTNATETCFTRKFLQPSHLRAIHIPGMSKNPDTFIADNQENLKENLENIDIENIKCTEWKKVNDKGKQKWRQVQTEIDKHTFIEQFMESTREFAMHVERVNIQYREMRRLPQELPEGHVQHGIRNVEKTPTIKHEYTSITSRIPRLPKIETKRYFMLYVTTQNNLV